MIYDGSPAKHLQSVARILVTRLKANNRCLYLNNPSTVRAFREHLNAMGVDVKREVGRDALVLSSATDHLVKGRFDVDKMLQMLAAAVDQSVADGFNGLWATGDMTWELGSEYSFEKLLSYECGLEALFRRRPALSGICQYHQDLLPEDSLRVALLKHPSTFINETLSRVNPFYSRMESPVPRRLSNPRLKKLIAQPSLVSSLAGRASRIDAAPHR